MFARISFGLILLLSLTRIHATPITSSFYHSSLLTGTRLIAGDLAENEFLIIADRKDVNPTKTSAQSRRQKRLPKHGNGPITATEKPEKSRLLALLNARLHQIFHQQNVIPAINKSKQTAKSISFKRSKQQTFMSFRLVDYHPDNRARATHKKLVSRKLLH